MSLFSRLLNVGKTSSFKYTSIKFDTRSDDKGILERIIVFVLDDENDAKPSLADIRSSTSVKSSEGVNVHYFATNTTEISCSMTDIDNVTPGDFIAEVKYLKAFKTHKVGDVVMGIDEDIPEDEVDSYVELTGAGSYSGNYFLDVSQSGKAYLTSMKFIDAGKRWKKENDSRRAEELLKGRISIS